MIASKKFGAKSSTNVETRSEYKLRTKSCLIRMKLRELNE